MAIFDRLALENRKRILKELMGKKYSDIVDREVVYTPNEEILLMSIKRLVYMGEVNEAEEILFDSIKKNSGINIVYIAAEFYMMLEEMQDEELEKYNFSREEVRSGIEDFKREIERIFG